MLNSVDFSGRPFHFIGIGGIGMSALAYVLAKRQLPVSGSDIRLNHITERLQEQGAHIFWSQEASNLDGFLLGGDRPLEPPQAQGTTSSTVAMTAPRPTVHSNLSLPPLLPQVVCSTAINTANAEYRAALELGCPIFHRSDILAALIREYKSIAVAGTHGKTTTSSMVGYLLYKAGLDPTIIVGGEVNAWEGNARFGRGDHLVAEADESDGSLVKFEPYLGVVTNIELDHPDHYGSLEEVIQTFRQFASQCQVLVGCADCETVVQALQPTITYSIQAHTGADYTADQVRYQSNGTVAQIWERGSCLGTLRLQVLGQHNLSNALAAIAIGRFLGLEFNQIADILATFEGARRRFEHRGEYHQITFVDDYAHHPSEIQATLSAARLRVGEGTSSGRVIAVFQPHRFSRTRTFLKEFGQAFGHADQVVLTDIYSAGEPNPGNISGQDLTAEVAYHHPQVVYQPTLNDVLTYLKHHLQPQDLVLFLGAGNLNQLIPELAQFYEAMDASGAAPNASTIQPAQSSLYASS
jgi:UDP-N-acetylmuramate--alanine ligase